MDLKVFPPRIPDGEAPTDGLTLPPYMEELSQRAYHIAREHHDITPDAVLHIVTEALFQAARDLRQGLPVDLQYIGSFTLSGGARVHYRPDEYLLRQGSE